MKYFKCKHNLVSGACPNCELEQYNSINNSNSPPIAKIQSSTLHPSDTISSHGRIENEAKSVKVLVDSISTLFDGL